MVSIYFYSMHITILKCPQSIKNKLFLLKITMAMAIRNSFNFPLCTKIISGTQD